MLRILAVLRTIYLIFIIGYTFRAMPIFTTVSATFDEQYARCSNALNLVVRAAWFAVAWIALEVLVGWIVALRASRKKAAPAS
jgi:hypothetical protein